jgi:hypothetical protein
MAYLKSMALKSRSIDPMPAQKGRLWLTFFFAVVSASSARAEIEWLASHQQHASAGVLSAKQWIDGRLGMSSPFEWVHAKSQIGVVKHGADWSLGLVRSHAGYMSSNRNALLLSAQDDLNDRVDLSSQGKFALGATVHTLASTIFSARLKHAFSDDVVLTLTPHLHVIHDYQRSTGDLSLQSVGAQSRLQGSVRRVGTRNYGFLLDDKANAGWGWGMDAGLRVRSAWGETLLDASNLLSQLRFSTVHFSNRQYDVNTSNGSDLVLSEIPSVRGVYGLTKTSGKLPVAWQVRFVPAMASNASLGLTAMGSDVRWFAAYGQKIKQYRWWMQTVETKNWSFGGDVQIADGWSLGAGVTATRLNNPAFTSFHLKAIW